jgi:hypothetical protein
MGLGIDMKYINKLINSKEFKRIHAKYAPAIREYFKNKS